MGRGTAAAPPVRVTLCVMTCATCGEVGSTCARCDSLRCHCAPCPCVTGTGSPRAFAAMRFFDKHGKSEMALAVEHLRALTRGWAGQS